MVCREELSPSCISCVCFNSFSFPPEIFSARPYESRASHNLIASCGLQMCWGMQGPGWGPSSLHPPHSSAPSRFCFCSPHQQKVGFAWPGASFCRRDLECSCSPTRLLELLCKQPSRALSETNCGTLCTSNSCSVVCMESAEHPRGIFTQTELLGLGCFCPHARAAFRAAAWSRLV